MAGKKLKSLRSRKFVKTVKKRLPWISHVINDEASAGEFNLTQMNIEPRRGSLCLACRGGRRLCGKTRCPALVKLYSLLKVRKWMHLDQLAGSSPPGIFVGRRGYPHVYAGPLVPPMLGETSHFDAPEEWVGRSVDEIVTFRTNLIRGKFRVNVTDLSENDRFLSRTLEMALSSTPVDTELTFQKKPSDRIFLDGTMQPMGPSAILKKMNVGSGNTDRRIEKAYRDHDLKAEQAVLNLYLSDVPVSKIQRVFSVGAFGVKQQRRMVPTRWSITAVDSTISRRLIEDQVKENKLINEYRVYEYNYLGNRFIILLLPFNWSYEWMEAWYPGTSWNPHSQNIAVGGDWEGYRGRTTYASIGGCYYAVRLAVAEFLAVERRQARVIAMREIHPSFLLPLGVWINRECIREAFHQSEHKFNTLQESLAYIGSRFTIRMNDWIEASSLLKDSIHQKRIIDYL
jgi:hypothetical protein